VTEQVEVVALVPSWASVQPPLLLNVPALPAGPLRAKLTVPCGNELPLPAVSITVAVHVDPSFSATDVGVQLIEVVVARTVGVSVKFCVAVPPFVTDTSAVAELKPVADAVRCAVPVAPPN